MDDNIKQQIEATEQEPFKPLSWLEQLKANALAAHQKGLALREEETARLNAKDAAIIAKAVESGTKYVEGIKELRATFKKKFARCFKGDDGVYRSFPYVLDLKDGHTQGVVVAGNGRYTLVTYTGYCYSIRHNHCMYVAHSPKTLEEAIGHVQDFIYGERW